MIEYLVESENDMVILTCSDCALKIYKELKEYGCKYLQEESSIMRELKESDIIEIIKIYSSVLKENLYFIMGMRGEELLEEKDIIIDTCVEDKISKNDIPKSSTIITIKYDEDDCEYCDESMVVEEIINNKDILTFEEAIRAAYRCGRDSALIELIEKANEMLFE